MSKYAPLTAFITMLVGMSLGSLSPLPAPLPDVQVVDTTHEYPVSEVDAWQVMGAINVEYKFSRIVDGELEGTFKVTNNTDHNIYYIGDDTVEGEGLNVMTWVRQNGKIEDGLKLSCWNGTDTQVLQPKGEALFPVQVPRNRKPFQAGFDFRFDGRGAWETAWVNVPRQTMRRTNGVTPQE